MQEWNSLLQASGEAGSTNELDYVVGMLERTTVTGQSLSIPCLVLPTRLLLF